MNPTQKVRKILSYYESDNPGTKTNIARILMAGKLGGTGRMVILPVDQGFEHGPIASFAPNPEAYDPHYHYKLAIDAGLSAYAAPLGMLEAGADTFAGAIPLILKVNSSNLLLNKNLAPDQSITASVKDALRLGCAAVGFTIYPGSDHSLHMMEEIKEMSAEAKSYGLVTVIWSYARGGMVSKDGETAHDVIAYAAHIAALLGAHIIKVKPSIDAIELDNAKKAFEKNPVSIKELKDRIAHIVKTTFNGRRLMVFSGGATKSTEDVFNEVRAIRDGGGNGSIIGRNTFQRPRPEALKLLSDIIEIYKGRL